MNFHGRPAYPIGFFAGITLLIVALSTSVLLWDLRKRELAHTRAETVGMTKIFAEQTERSFESANLVLKGIQNRLAAPYANDFSFNSIEIHLLLATRVLGMRQMDALYLVDSKGEVVNSSLEHPVKRFDVSQQDYFKAFTSAKPPSFFISKPYLNPQLKVWNIFVARSVTNQAGNFKGVIVGVIDIAHFEDVYKLLKLDYARQVSLYRDNGILIASYPHRENMIGVIGPELGEIIPILEAGKILFVSHQKNSR